MKEARKKRREYLWRIASATTLICIGLVLFVFFGLLTLGSGLMTLLWAFAFPPVALIGLILTAIVGSFAYLGIRTTLHAHNGSLDIAHVPSVREQIANLPADEVLLRGLTSRRPHRKNC